MTISKKLSIFLFSLLLVFASALFVGCGEKDYSKTRVTCSESYVELYVGEEKEITFTIEKPVDKMSEKLLFTLSDTVYCGVEEVFSQDYQTTYKITGRKGSSIPITLDVYTEDGLIHASNVEIRVRQISQTLQSASNELFISWTSADGDDEVGTSSVLAPNANDFVFEEGTTEKDLLFSFAGESISAPPSISKNGDSYPFEFVSIETALDTIGNAYLIFTDKNGSKKTIRTGEDDFVDFNIDNLASYESYEIGDEFTFFAVYSTQNEGTETENVLMCQRKFKIMNTIKVLSTVKFGYSIVEVEGDKVPSTKPFDKENNNIYIGDIKNEINLVNSVAETSITLVPSYFHEIDKTETSSSSADFKMAYIAVQVEKNPELKISSKSRNANILSSRFLFDTDDKPGYTTYWFEVSSTTGSEATTFLDINFYYDGYENVNAPSVNNAISIPIRIANRPQKLLINKQESINELTFYNEYVDDDFGWQPFMFSLAPTGSSISSLEIDLEDTGLKARYKGNDYLGGTLIVDSIDDVVYVRGIDGASTVTGKALSIKLVFDVIMKDSIEVLVPYKVIDGATDITWVASANASLESKIYIDAKNQEGVEFNYLKADKAFEEFSFRKIGGENVAVFEFEKSSICEGDNILNFSIRSTGVIETGTYIIVLGNGCQEIITIEAIETLMPISTQTTNSYGNVKGVETEQETIYYLLNNLNSVTDYFDVAIIEEDKVNARAMSSFTLSINGTGSSPVVMYASKTDVNKFNVFLSGANGSNEIKITAKGNKINKEAFTLDVEGEETCTIRVVSFDYINKLNIYKEVEAGKKLSEESQATYSTIYTGAENVELRKVSFSLEVGNSNAFLFKKGDEWNEEVFNSLNFVGWEYDKVIHYYSPSAPTFACGNYGFFNMETMTFVGNQNATTGHSITIIARVIQFGKTYSYSLNINFVSYKNVSGIYLQEQLTELTFSAIRPNLLQPIVAFATPGDATNREVSAYIVGNSIEDAKNNTYEMFSYDEAVDRTNSDGRYMFNISVNQKFLDASSSISNKEFTATLWIVATEWKNGDTSIYANYEKSAINVKLKFENGTVENRYTLTTVEDVLQIGNNLSSHYKLTTNIDISSIASKLPLGIFSGSIIGTREQAQISGINIQVPTNNSTKESNEGTTNLSLGLFSSIASNAYIKNIKFSGSINVDATSSSANIGLIAGLNEGTLTNIGVILSASQVLIKSGSVGGIVGVNKGTILQDYSYINFNSGSIDDIPKTQKPTILMTGEFVIKGYGEAIDIIYVGGIAGENFGTIKKIDSSSISSIGYNNYMAYSLISADCALKTTGSYTNSIYLGGLVGINSSGEIIGCNSEGKLYNSFKVDDSSANVAVYFSAGKGIVVGGQVRSSLNGAYVGGVAGETNCLGESFAGITTRTFVRGSGVNVALIAKYPKTTQKNTEENSANRTSYSIQAVDNGAEGLNASMLIISNSSTTSLTDSGIAFGSNTSYMFDEDGNGVKDTFHTYVNRTFVEASDNININTIVGDANSYYGDVVVVNEEGIIGFQNKFSLQLASASIGKQDGNEMTAPDQAKKAFYMYYFAAGSTYENGSIGSLQETLDDQLNTLPTTHKYYPISSNDISLISANPEILTIDINGRIVVKQTGVAEIYATSLLNSAERNTFYIYVVNYFNSSDESIIYSEQSNSGVAVDNTQIKIHANKATTLFVMPSYKLDFPDENNSIGIHIEKDGTGKINNQFVILLENDDIEVDLEIKEDKLDIKCVGNTIVIARNSSTEESKDYSLIITPKISFTKSEETFFANVNKKLENVTVSYTKGALEIKNKMFDEVTIFSSKIVKDIIEIRSTADSSEYPLLQIQDGERNKIEGWEIPKIDSTSVSEGDVTLTSESSLFEVKAKLLSANKENVTSVSGIKIFKYEIEISVNTDSDTFKNRMTSEEDIYNLYNFVFSASTNEDVNMLLPVSFEKVNVETMSIDNYKYSSLETSTDLVYPGEEGLLTISISPLDGDFDYILIENASENFQTGNASANFGLSQRLTSSTDGDLFKKDYIAGSTIQRGIRLTREEIIAAYKEANAENFNGQIYINYTMGTYNVVDGSTSTIVVSACKVGEEPLVVSKPLTVKLSYYATVTIDGKEVIGDAYAVARGLEYKLNLDTYGYQRENVVISENSNYASIITRDGEYYLVITGDTINYESTDATFKVSVSATMEDNTRPFNSEIVVKIQEYVINYNGEKLVNQDVVSGMDEGVINVQVGTGLRLSIDLRDYIEFDQTNQTIIKQINDFLEQMSSNGSWEAKTNLNASGTAPIYVSADDLSGYKVPLKTTDLTNYYFKYSNRIVTPIKTHAPEDKSYYITYNGAFKVVDGLYSYVDSDANNASSTIKTRFYLNVFTSSSEESPIPIYEYKDLIRMQRGGYYILLNDIEIPNTNVVDDNGNVITEAFSPIAGNFASLDGNGLTISFLAGSYDFGNATNIALFSTLAEDSIIRNLNVLYSTSLSSLANSAYDIDEGFKTTSFRTTSSEFSFGGIVAENNGAITNCRVTTAINSVSNANEHTYLTVFANSAIDEGTSCYMGGIAGRNNGFITNCIVSAKIKSPFNLGGIAGINAGKIAGCVFKNGVLDNIPASNSAVAGITVVNEGNGQILTSYVSGTPNTNKVFSVVTNSTERVNLLTSSFFSCGFVYQNNGYISDCYSDTRLRDESTTAGYQLSGFVGINGSKIRNSFSTSILQGNRSTSYGFVVSNVLDENQGTITNCYFLAGLDDSEGSDGQIINSDINRTQFEGVKALTPAQFADFDTYFSEYAYHNYISTGAIWFYPNGNGSSDYYEYSVMNEKVNGALSVTNVSRSLKPFAGGRLELVSPNIEVLSRRIFENAVVDDITGDITYYYTDATEGFAPTRGSLHNPRIIYNAETMENEILQTSSSAGLNTQNFRFVADIDYTRYEGLSNLYTVTYAGNMEGNGMLVSGIGLESTKAMTNAGLFAGVGYSAQYYGSIKNLTIAPTMINFAETINVGGIAGVLKYGRLFDVSTVMYNENQTTVIGQSFVGGIVGRAVSSYEITDSYSELNVTSNYIPTGDARYTETGGNEAVYSYTGGILGYAGNGKIYNSRIARTTSVIGGRAGFLFGGIGRNASVNYSYLELDTSATLKSNQYAGLIAGEVSGTLNNSFVDSNGAENSFVDVVSRRPKAVGGIVGLLAGGKISNAVNYQIVRMTNVNSSNQYVEIIGGIVGIVASNDNTISQIVDSISASNLYGRKIVGGAVGAVNSPLRMDSVAVKGSQSGSPILSVEGQTVNPQIGGIVGSLGNEQLSTINTASLVLTNSYCNVDIKIRTSTSGLESTASAGGLIGYSSINPTLSYCYTTSHIEAEVYDSRALGDTVEYVEESDGKARYNKTIIDTIYDTVYFYGNNVSDYVSGNVYISFKTKTAEKSIGLSVNCYGKPSLNNGTTAGGQETNTTEALNNLFINKFERANDTRTIFFYSSYVEPNTETTYTYAYEFVATANGETTSSFYVEDPNDNTQLVCLNSVGAIAENAVRISRSEIHQVGIYRDASMNVYSKNIISLEETTSEETIKIYKFTNLLDDSASFFCKEVMKGTTTEITYYTNEELEDPHKIEDGDARLNLTQIWNMGVWDQLSSFEFEKPENLTWLYKVMWGNNQTNALRD